MAEDGGTEPGDDQQVPAAPSPCVGIRTPAPGLCANCDAVADDQEVGRAGRLIQSFRRGEYHVPLRTQEAPAAVLGELVHLHELVAGGGEVEVEPEVECAHTAGFFYPGGRPARRRRRRRGSRVGRPLGRGARCAGSRRGLRRPAGPGAGGPPPVAGSGAGSHRCYRALSRPSAPRRRLGRVDAV